METSASFEAGPRHCFTRQEMPNLMLEFLLGIDLDRILRESTIADELDDPELQNVQTRLLHTGSRMSQIENGPNLGTRWPESRCLHWPSSLAGPPGCPVSQLQIRELLHMRHILLLPDPAYRCRGDLFPVALD